MEISLRSYLSPHALGETPLLHQWFFSSLHSLSLTLVLSISHALLEARTMTRPLFQFPLAVHPNPMVRYICTLALDTSFSCSDT